MLTLNYRQTVKDNSVLFFVNWWSTFRILFETKIKHFSPLVCRWSFWNGVGKIEINSPKVNVWCGLFYDVVIGPYFFNQPIIKQENVLNTLLQFALPHLRVIFQLDVARPHWGLGVRKSLERRIYQLIICHHHHILQLLTFLPFTHSNIQNSQWNSIFYHKQSVKLCKKNCLVY